MKKHLSTILLVLILLAGLAILLYPTASDYWNSFHQSRAIASYAESVSNLTAVDYEKLWLDANAYNQALIQKGNLCVSSEEEHAAYESLLNITGNGIMGYIEIPKINVSLPIYHGTEESVLQIAVGHIEGTGLPVGGPSTHSVLSGHRGLPSATLFSNLDQLDEGDVFLLRILDETLTYEVDQIHIVLPQETDDLTIVNDRDLCTLVTCTPYGINSHRLLVRGSRIENQESASSARITAEAVRIDPVLVAPVAAIPMLLVLALLLVTPSGRRKPKRIQSKKKT